MKKITTIATAALIGFASLTSGAEAGDRGSAIVAGVIGGLAVGALAGAAIAESHPPRGYVNDDYDSVPVYRPRARLRIYHYEAAPYYDRYGYSYDDQYYDSWHDD